jgi:hypothetical protein
MIQITRVGQSNYQYRMVYSTIDRDTSLTHLYYGAYLNAATFKTVENVYETQIECPPNGMVVPEDKVR